MNFNNLNEHQKEAALHVQGPMLILAGAGSGKTATLVARVKNLIDQKSAKAEEICVLTFTNKAARELKNRVQNDKIWAGTFHSFGLQILKRHYKFLNLPKYFGILDSQDASSLVRELLRTVNISGKTQFDDKQILSMMSRAREGIQTVADDNYKTALEWLLPKYENKKKVLGVVDFDDLILKPLELFKKNTEALDQEKQFFTQMMIDEFQDTNISQMKLIDYFVKDHQNLTVVGDDDQSIYGWRGANVRNILDFPKKYKKCKVVRLEDNYRSSKPILDLANVVIRENQNRHDKALKPTLQKIAKKPELFIYETDLDEIDGVVREIYNFTNTDGFRHKEIAILYRSNTQGAILETELKSKNIPYKISGGLSFLERKEVKDVLAYIRCAFHPHDVSYRRIFNVPHRGLGETTTEALHNYSQKRNISFLEQARKWRDVGIQPKAGESIDRLNQQISELKSGLLTGVPSKTLIDFLTRIGFRDYINSSSKDPKITQKKWNWVEILARTLDKFIKTANPKVKDYIEFLSFMELGNTDEEKEEATDGVQLLTLHASKGLEFPCVIIMGVEEDILPHKTLGTDTTEERKLFYVGITRAQNRLILTRAKKRNVNGQLKLRTPSRFISKITNELLQTYPEGFRPVSSVERKRLLSDLFQKLDANTTANAAANPKDTI